MSDLLLLSVYIHIVRPDLSYRFLALKVTKHLAGLRKFSVRKITFVITAHNIKERCNWKT